LNLLHEINAMSDSNKTADDQALPPPFLVPMETATGVRYVRPPEARRHRTAASLFVRLDLFAIGILAAATAFATYSLVLGSPAVPPWQAALAMLYLLQLALDMAAVGRHLWGAISFSVGDHEIELAEGRLRAGRRWGPFWFAAQSLPVARLRRLVIVRWPPDHLSGLNWDLMAEPHAGPALSLVSAYDMPEDIRSIARDLHGRLGASLARSLDWPALVEEDWPPERAARPWRPRSLLPGGAYSWLVVHSAGCVGLGCIAVMVMENRPRVPWPIAALAGAVLQQVFVFLANVAFLKASRDPQRP
jgi:hypothetical protein